MKRLYIAASKSTPEIDLDPEQNLLCIRGQSYPENAFQFYEPILQWVDSFLAELKAHLEIRIDFAMPYINTSSSKCIFMLLDKLGKAHVSGKRIVVNWYYDVNNESELDCAEEFAEDAEMEFNLVPRSEVDKERCGVPS